MAKHPIKPKKDDDFSALMASGFGRLPYDELREFAATLRIALTVAEKENAELKRINKKCFDEIENLKKIITDRELKITEFTQSATEIAEAFGECIGYSIQDMTLGVGNIIYKAAERDQASNQAKKNRSKRTSLTNLVKNEALRLYKAKKWRSVRAAAGEIFTEVQKFAEALDMKGGKNISLVKGKAFEDSLRRWVNEKTAPDNVP